jgi:hypothetical protein
MILKRAVSVFFLGLSGCGVALPTPTPDRPVYAGFDTWRYPGDEVMNNWRESSPYRWVGYYLQAPCNRDSSFSGKRRFLGQSGWGTAIIYVGQQVFEGETPAEITETTLCTSQFLTADRGTIDGGDAVERAYGEGFPPGSIIFLDIERMSRIPPEMITYYQAWLQTVLDDGRYRPGTYVHVANAAGFYSVAQSLLQRRGIEESIPFWIAGSNGFTLESPPEASGYRFAHIWQGVLDSPRTWGGRTLSVDENVSRFPSPSSPDAR